MIAELPSEEIIGYLLDPPSIRGIAKDAFEVIELARLKNLSSKPPLSKKLSPSTQSLSSDAGSLKGGRDDDW